MNLRTLSESLAPLAASMHALTDTNCEGVRVEGGALVFDLDTSELQNQIEDLKTGEENLTAEVKSLEEENAGLELRAEKAEALLEEVKQEDAPGETLTRYRERAEKAEAEVALARRGIVEARAERDALRKRKGVTVALFANEREVLRLINCMAQRAESRKTEAGFTNHTRPDRTFEQLQADAAELLSKLYS